MKRSREVITTEDLIRLKQTQVFNMHEIARQAGINEKQLMAYTYPRNRMKFHKKMKRNERLRRVLMEIIRVLEDVVGRPKPK